MGKRAPEVEKLPPYRDQWTSYGHGLDLMPVQYIGPSIHARDEGKTKTYTFYGETSEEAKKYARAWARKHKIKLVEVADEPE